MPSSPSTDPDPASSRSNSTWPATAFRAVRRLLLLLLAGTALYLALCVVALLLYSVAAPPITGVQLQRTAQAIVGGDPVRRAYDPIPMAEMSPSLPLAAVAGEDSRFFEHWGIDWEAVGEAIEEYRNGERLRGGSTITQQLVKNLFMTTHSTYLRKILEVPLTYAAELVLSKHRILELYLNVIEWGPGVYGAEAAAQYHYGTSARSLTRSQSAALAACIPNPLARRPQSVGWYQSVILERMAILGHLPLASTPRPSPPETSTSPAPDSSSTPASDSVSVPPDSLPPLPESMPAGVEPAPDSVPVDSPEASTDSMAPDTASSL